MVLILKQPLAVRTIFMTCYTNIIIIITQIVIHLSVWILYDTKLNDLFNI